jgi:hypothetical protein
MDNLLAIVKEGQIITITGNELLLISLVKKKIYQKHKISNPEVENKLAGRPYWIFEYRDLFFNCNVLSFLEYFQTNELFEVRLIRNGKYFNVYAYYTKNELNQLTIKIAKGAKKKRISEIISDSNLSLIEKLNLCDNVIKSGNASKS